MKRKKKLHNEFLIPEYFKSFENILSDLFRDVYD